MSKLLTNCAGDKLLVNCAGTKILTSFTPTSCSQVTGKSITVSFSGIELCDHCVFYGFTERIRFLELEPNVSGTDTIDSYDHPVIGSGTIMIWSGYPPNCLATPDIYPVDLRLHVSCGQIYVAACVPDTLLVYAFPFQATLGSTGSEFYEGNILYNESPVCSLNSPAGGGQVEITAFNPC